MPLACARGKEWDSPDMLDHMIPSQVRMQADMRAVAAGSLARPRYQVPGCVLSAGCMSSSAFSLVAVLWLSPALSLSLSLPLPSPPGLARV